MVVTTLGDPNEDVQARATQEIYRIAHTSLFVDNAQTETEAQGQA